MAYPKSSQAFIGFALVIAFITACASPATPPELTSSAGSNTPPSATPETVDSIVPQLEHRIAVRQVEGQGEFYDIETGETFISRGVNYVFVPEGDSYNVNLLRVGVYDGQRTRDDFSVLASLGYNTVRVFLDHCGLGNGCMTQANQQGLNPAYLDNIVDMMLAAREAGLFLIFTSNDLPDGGGYADEANQGANEQFAGYRNTYYLRPQAISATRHYWRDLLTGLAEREAAFDAVLGWQLLNEQWMFLEQPPLSLTSGIVETTTGSYDMSDPEQKELMVSDGLVYYIAQMKEEILLHDPTALVTMGFFVPELVAPDWYVETASLLQNSTLDFFDFHAYPGDLSLERYAEAFGMLGYSAKPILLGEYGPFRSIFEDINRAARIVNQWVVDSCEYGFDGWLYWAYYPAGTDTDDTTWGLTDEEGYLLNLFAPVNLPNPCIGVEIANDNLAYNKPTKASSSLPEEPPAQAVDDNPGTQWGAGDSPWQWIEIDLQGTYQITEIRLLVAQWPDGDTIHRVQVRNSSADEFVSVHEFSGSTQDNDWLIFLPELPLEDITHIRVLTISSPSWVAWKEISVFGEAVQP